MSVCNSPESPFDTDRFFTFTVNDESYRGSIHFSHCFSDNPKFVDVLQNAVFRNKTYGDNRAEWHRNTTPIHAWMKAHMLRLSWGYGEHLLSRFLQAHPVICMNFGFPTKHPYDASGSPSQSRLWEMWHKEFNEVQKEFVRTATKEAMAFAREQGIPAPDPVFRPEELDITTKQSEQRIVTEKTKDVWKKAKPFVTDCFYLKRADNHYHHENAFWEQHTYMGMRQDMYAQSGQHSFSLASEREETPSASNHRYQIGKLSVEETRSMLHETTDELIKRARRDSELVGKLSAAIDITKGNPWTGKIKRDSENKITEDWILGYSDSRYYYQWATIQIVGLDIPLVLDAIPVKRGMERAKIVDSLLENALKLVDDIELVMMDREFDSKGVKDACEKHNICYLNPARKYSSENAKCTELREAGKTVHIEEDDGPSRKRIYLPSIKSTNKDNSTKEVEDENNIRKELENEFAEIGGDDFRGLVDEVRQEESKKQVRGNNEDSRSYTLFETNHPLIQLEDGDSEVDRIHMAEKMARRYRHRWGIENGYKKIKKFRVRTTSKRHTYRFFNFVFACVLYNVWRLVDLLVKVEIEGENAEYAPRIDANQFLTVAKDYYGLDNPPD